MNRHLYGIGSDSYGEARLAKLKTYLERRGVTLKVGTNELPEGIAGEFKVEADGTMTLLLKKDPPKQLVWHELGHYLHSKKVGWEKYRDLPREIGNNVPEQYVFDLLERPTRWSRLSPSYRDHMIWYITERWGGVGR